MRTCWLAVAGSVALTIGGSAFAGDSPAAQQVDDPESLSVLKTISKANIDDQETRGELAPFELDLSESSDPYRGVASLWYDGVDGLWASSFGHLHRLDRDSTRASESFELGFNWAVAGSGTRAVGGYRVVFVSEDGKLLEIVGGKQSLQQITLPEGDSLFSVHVDSEGTIYAVGRGHLYVRDGREWTSYSYPRELSPLAATVSPGGQLFIAGRDGLLLRFFGGAFDLPIMAGLSVDAQQSPWHALWYSPANRRLWIRAGKDRLISLEEGTGNLQELRIPNFDPELSQAPSEPGILAGQGEAGGDRLVCVMGQVVVLYQHGQFFQVSRERPSIRDLVLVPDEDAVYLATGDGVRRRSIELQVDEDVDAPLDLQEKKRLERNERFLQRIDKQQKSSLFWFPAVTFETGVGQGMQRDAHLYFEGGAAFLLSWRPLFSSRLSPWILPEIAYRKVALRSPGAHELNSGIGIGGGNDWLALFYRPRLSAAWSDRHSKQKSMNLGFRHGLSLQFLWGLLALNVDHRTRHPRTGGPSRKPSADMQGEHRFEIGLAANLAAWFYFFQRPKP